MVSWGVQGGECDGNGKITAGNEKLMEVGYLGEMCGSRNKVSK